MNQRHDFIFKMWTDYLKYFIHWLIHETLYSLLNITWMLL